MKAVVTLGGGAVIKGSMKGTGKVLCIDLSTGYPGVFTLCKCIDCTHEMYTLCGLYIMFYSGSMDMVLRLEIAPFLSYDGCNSNASICKSVCASLPPSFSPFSFLSVVPTPAEVSMHTHTGLAVTRCNALSETRIHN